MVKRTRRRSVYVFKLLANVIICREPELHWMLRRGAVHDALATIATF